MTNPRSGHHADRVYQAAADKSLTQVLNLGSPVDVSWRRCLNDFNLDPARDYQPSIVDQNLLKSLQAEHEELVQIARAEMDSLYEQIAGSGYALLLADTAGVILCEKVDPVLKRMFEHSGLIIGAQWSEEHEGTNGIGTCAREARPITIHQSDHFRSRHIGLTCSGAPIHDQYGRVIAVLDASCVNGASSRESQMHTVALVNTSARLIEKCLFLRRHHTDSLLRFHHRPEFVDLLHDGAIAVDGDGRIVATDMTGYKLLGARDRSELVGRSIEEVFDTSYDALSATGNLGHRAICELRDTLHGRRYYACMVRAGQGNARLSAKPAGDSSRALVHMGRKDVPAQLSLMDLAGEDPKMIRNVRNAQRIADRPVSVIIHGPTGSGKEAFAKALHEYSTRAKRPFIAINCGAIPESLIESELFGYAPGAFTGARRDGMRGKIAQSSGGTLFLDEIGDMPLLLQTRLLRALEEQEVTPLGGDAVIKVDLRIICASHRDLRALVESGDFREDLFYRLNGIMLELPALAARRDKESLIRKCIASESGDLPEAAIEMNALQRLLAYEWPGNIRELRNAIRTSLALCDDQVIRLSDLPADIAHPRTLSRQVHAMPVDCAVPVSFEGAEREALVRVIEQHGWVMSRVAAHFGISRNTLYRKIKRHGLSLERPGLGSRPVPTE